MLSWWVATVTRHQCLIHVLLPCLMLLLLLLVVVMVMSGAAQWITMKQLLAAAHRLPTSTNHCQHLPVTRWLAILISSMKTSISTWHRSPTDCDSERSHVTLHNIVFQCRSAVTALLRLRNTFTYLLYLITLMCCEAERLIYFMTYFRRLCFTTVSGVL